MRPRLIGRAMARAEADEQVRAEMLALFQEYYDGAAPESFARDLDGKSHIIVLRDIAGALQGFSTLVFYESDADDRRIGVVYSGDTIIRPAYWGTPELQRIWLATVLEQSAKLPQPLYWLLISSGYKTYRFLPVFYKAFYPRYDEPTPPDIQKLMAHLAGERFGADYCAERGTVRFTQGATPLQKGIADVSAARMQDPHIAFFVARNPGYVQGDELVCLAQVHPENFTAAARRILR